jgi:SAM-dependent methyltransferase
MISLEEYLLCPFCRKTLIKKPHYFECVACNKQFPIKNGIIYFTSEKSKKVSSKFKSDWEEILHNVSENIIESRSHIVDINSILKKVDSIDNKLILDAGCGRGLSTVSLLEKNANVIFLDIIPEALKVVSKIIEFRNYNSNFLLIVADLNSIPIKKESIDIIWSGGVLEHFKETFIPYSELYRVLKQNGDIIFTIPNKFGLQRFLSSLKEKLYDSHEDHFEKGFIYYNLYKFFPSYAFLEYNISMTGFVQSYYDYLIPFFNLKPLKVIFIVYVYIISFLSKIFPKIKLGVSWFRLYGKKK